MGFYTPLFGRFYRPHHFDIESVSQPLVMCADISACDSPVSTLEQFPTPDDRQNSRTKHDSRVNDIQQRERGVPSEYEQYDEQKPQRTTRWLLGGGRHAYPALGGDLTYRYREMLQ